LLHKQWLNLLIKKETLFEFTIICACKIGYKFKEKLETFLQPRLNFKAGAVGARGSDSVLSLKVSGLDSATILQSLKDILNLMKESFLK
jgi:hypothetical protein